MNERILDFARKPDGHHENVTSPLKSRGQIRRRLIAYRRTVDEPIRRMNIAVRDVQKLMEEGNSRAIEAFTKLAIDMVRSLNAGATRYPARFRPVARKCFSFPVLKARTERFNEKHKPIIEGLDVGAEAPFSAEVIERIPRANAPVRTAMELLCRIESYRSPLSRLHFRLGLIRTPAWIDQISKLDDFSCSTCADWFSVAWQIVMDENKGTPEMNPDLAKMGAYRQYHSEKQGAQKRVTEKTRQSNIRDGIKEKLKQAVARIANFPNKTRKKLGESQLMGTCDDVPDENKYSPKGCG